MDTQQGRCLIIVVLWFLVNKVIRSARREEGLAVVEALWVHRRRV